jgi:mannose-1-phosphate guanylyltransferase/mannose-6-phosphate isomerase
MNKISHQIVPVMLCGVSGAKLWPLSRLGFPKEFLVLSGMASLFQLAILQKPKKN